MVESAASLVGNLLGQIRAETAHLTPLIESAQEPLKSVAQQTVDQQKSLIRDDFMKLIAKEDQAYSRSEDRLLISTWRSEWISWAKNQIEILRNLHNAMKYDPRDYAIMASNVYSQLCLSGKEWHDIRILAENVRAFPNSTDVVAYIAEIILVRLQYIERDPQSYNVRLTADGRRNCSRGIEIPPSDIQRLRIRLGMT